jgi:glyoxylate/hydroxypyruvate reductase A
MPLLIIGSERSEEFADAARKARPDADIRVWPNAGRIEEVRYALAWKPKHGDLAKLANLELIVSVGAGVDHLMTDPALPSVPVARYVDPYLSARMAEYVASQVLWHQRRMCELVEQQRAKVWKYIREPAAHQVRVGVMGLGEMGGNSLTALKAFGYQLRGWSRTPRSIAGVTTFHGNDGLDPFLAETDILVCLLPLTPETRGILDRSLIRKLSTKGRHERWPGPVLINAGRGGQQVEADIIAALTAGELLGASLDVFETEPLPTTSPLWSHPRVIITPHMAAESTPEAITAYCFRQMDRHRRGEPIENIVDRTRGY